MESLQESNGDRPSEVEQLQVKCLRLENKVKTLKEVSSIRKGLMELREREAKDLVRKLDNFEETFKTEQKMRWDLSAKLKASDSDCRELSVKLSENIIASNQAKTQYEARLRSLAIQLDEAAESLKEVRRNRDATVEKLKRLTTNFETYQVEMEHKLSVAEEQRIADDQAREEQVVEVNDLRTALEMSLEENLRLRTVVEGTMCQLQSQESMTTLENQLLSNSVVQNAEIFNHSTVIDVDDFIERLEEGETDEVVQVPEHSENCYIKVMGKNGEESGVVLSLSRTFAQLKDLIVEKKGLQHEIHGLKKLGKKLESKVDRQSRRLYLVSLEVGKTWKLVSKLRAQFGQLHTSKSVQRYEIQEKRRFVAKLKRELGASREKWMKLREKNAASQIEWESIRDEFARRRAEVTASRESAFFEDSSSTTASSSIDGDLSEIDSPTFDDDSQAQAMTLNETELTSDIDTDTAGLGNRVSANFSYEDLVNRRAQRLLQLEEECRLLFRKMEVSKARNTTLASKLANLHNHYGSSDEHSEDMVLDGDESELLSEASGDTAYESRSEDTILSNFRDDLEITDAEISTEVIIDCDDDAENIGALTELQPQLNLGPVPNPCSTVTTEDKGLENKAQLLEVVDEDANELTSIVSQASYNYSSNPNLPVAPQELSRTEDKSEGSTLPVHSLSRIIIQQLPKLLGILKQENCSLQRAVVESRQAMKETELKLDEQRKQVKASLHQEMDLRTELDLKQRLIRELTTKIQIATENYHAINEEHGQMSEYIQIKLQETKVQEQRKLVKMRHLKNCTKCLKKFTLFKRKVHCSTCGYSFCGDCLLPQEFPTPNERENRTKKLLICGPCDERKRKLDAVVQEHFKNLRL